jgi:hypothetical protein
VSFDLSRIRDRVVILHDSSICDKPQADYHAEKREGMGNRTNDARGRADREDSRIHTVHLYLSVVLVRKNEWSFPKTYLWHGDRGSRVDLMRRETASGVVARSSDSVDRSSISDNFPSTFFVF